jgi:hypothetical protein
VLDARIHDKGGAGQDPRPDLVVAGASGARDEAGEVAQILASFA